MDERMIDYNICKQFGIQQKQKEFECFIDVCLKNNVKNILEIGACDGGSTVGLLQLFDVTTITFDYQENYNKIKMLYPNWKLFVGDSHDIQTYHNIKDEYFDAMFIDGDHTEIGVKKDFEMYNNNIKKIIGFHDIVDSEHHKNQNCTVYEYWKSIKNSYKNEEYIFDNFEWGGIGIVYK